MTDREEFRAQLREIAENEPARLVNLVETMSDRMETQRMLADSSMEVGTILAWPVSYPREVREAAWSLSQRAITELGEILDAADDDE